MYGHNTQNSYTDYSGNNYIFNYYLKDHLGNNRVVIDISSGNNPTRVQATSFGLPYAYGTAAVSPSNRYGT